MGFMKWILGGGFKGGHHGSNNKHGYSKHGSRDYYGSQEPTQDPQQSNDLKCTKCNSLNAYDSKFCKQCGSSMLPDRCGQCNSVLVGDSKFCSQCGKAR